MNKKVNGGEFSQDRTVRFPVLDLEVVGPNDLTRTAAELLVSSRDLCVPVVTKDYGDTIKGTVDLQLTPGKVIEKQRSAHEIAFGRLLKRRVDKQSSLGHQMYVALKPFYDDRSALHEMLGGMRLASLGVPTYEPVGVFRAVSGNSLLLTKASDTLMGLDRDNWVQSRHVTSEQDAVDAERNNKTVRDIAGVMAWLHVNGVFHPDGQIKNWGVTPTGQIGVFDMERHLVNMESGRDAVQLAWGDIDKLTASLVSARKDTGVYGVGMLHNLGPKDLKKSVRELIIDPYIDCMVEFGLTLDRPEFDVAERAEYLIEGVEHSFDIAVSGGWPSIYQYKQVMVA